MNKDRRKQLEEIAEQIGALKDRLEDLRATEQASFDNMPEGFQQAENGQKMEAAVATIEEVIDSLESASGDLQELVSE